jgi:hypothetical protein
MQSFRATNDRTWRRRPFRRPGFQALFGAPDELEKFRRAVGEIIVELDRQLISSTLRSQPSLLGETKDEGLI